MYGKKRKWLLKAEGRFHLRTDYLTVKGYGSNEIVIQKSRFISYINRAETIDAAQSFIQKIKNKIGMQPTIVLPILSANMMKFKRRTMTVNQVVQPVFRCLTC